jgi:SAM-dependent methyltransferase
MASSLVKLLHNKKTHQNKSETKYQKSSSTSAIKHKIYDIIPGLVWRQSQRIGEMLEIFNPIRPIESFCDVGSGDGSITVAIALVYEIPLVYGTDMIKSSEFKPYLPKITAKTKANEIDAIKKYKGNTIKFNYSENVGNHIHLENHAVQLATCFVSIHHFKDHDGMFNEIIRILRPRGFLYIREHDVDGTPDEIKAITKYLDDTHAWWEHETGEDQECDGHSGKVARYWSRAELREKLELDFGFQWLAGSIVSPTDKQHRYVSLFINNNETLKPEVEQAKLQELSQSLTMVVGSDYPRRPYNSDHGMKRKQSGILDSENYY